MNTTGIADDPGIFLSILDLELAARTLAEAVTHGEHRSIRYGPGIEFESHREYRHGDDMRRINWALYAKQRRLYTRESRHESMRPAYLLVDATGSMDVEHGPFSKYGYAARLAGAFAFLAVKQGDRPALGLLRDKLEIAMEPRTGYNHALGICAALSEASPTGQGSLPRGISACHTLCARPGFVILISDFLDEEEKIFSELSAFQARGHDVLAIQVLDPFEVEIPSSGDYEFLDVETDQKLRTTSDDFHRRHLETVRQWRENLKTSAIGAGFRWESVTTNDSMVGTLSRILGKF